MEVLLVIVFLILVSYVLLHTNNTLPPVKEKPALHNHKHVVKQVLQDLSSGDKVSIMGGNCNVNLYTRNTIDVDRENKFKSLINQLFQSIYGLTDEVYSVQEINNLYEQLDSLGNGRYIVDATLNSKQNYYTTKVILDIAMLQGDILLNTVSTNEASNNNIVNRFDMVYQDQGILVERNNFGENIRKLLDNEYKKLNQLIVVDTSAMDAKNYPLDGVISLNSAMNLYYPASVSTQTVNNLDTKGMSGLTEQYFPTDLKTINSPQYCDKTKENCVFYHNTTTTDYTQPYMAPGLFFDRSSYPVN
jgi:hypothetical protein